MRLQDLMFLLPHQPTVYWPHLFEHYQPYATLGSAILVRFQGKRDSGTNPHCTKHNPCNLLESSRTLLPVTDTHDSLNTDHS